MEVLRYGAFDIHDSVARWRRDPDVCVEMRPSASSWCLAEGLWSPQGAPLPESCPSAITGMCIWAKHDCTFHFTPRAKGGRGAKRSISNPADRADLLRRLEKGHSLAQVRISADPFGAYQNHLIGWQADSVRRLGIRRLYYALPIDEYAATIREFERYLPLHVIRPLQTILEHHYEVLSAKLRHEIPAEIECVRPMKERSLSPLESYLWPYRNLDVDVALEELEELRLPYEVHQAGHPVPPVLTAVLDDPCPYYRPRGAPRPSDHIIAGGG